MTSQQRIEHEALQDTIRLEKAPEALIKLRRSAQGSIGLHQAPRLPRGSIEFLWLHSGPQGATGLHRALESYKRLQKAPQRSIGRYRASQGSIGCHRGQQGSRAPYGPHKAPQGSAGLHRTPEALIRFPYFHRAPQDSMGQLGSVSGDGKGTAKHQTT